MTISRRRFVRSLGLSVCSCRLWVGGLRYLVGPMGAMMGLGQTGGEAQAAGEVALDVAYAGSMAPVMERIIFAAAAKELKLVLHGRAQGSLALARLIVGGAINCDVFIPVTPRPCMIVLRAGKAKCAYPFARTEVVIAYNPKSRFASELRQAAERRDGSWREVLKHPGFRFGRTDPRVDPLGLNIIFALELAARYYNDPELVRRVLGPILNPSQIFLEPELMARLQASQLDACAAYLNQPVAFGLPYIELAPEINLGDSRFESFYRQVSVEIEGKRYEPEPLVFYAMALKDSRNLTHAERFVRWLSEKTAQELLVRNGYRAAVGLTPLCA